MTLKYLLLNIMLVSVVTWAYAQPSEPVGFNVIALQDTLELRWNQNPGVDGVTSYHIYRSIDSVSFSLINTIPDGPSPEYIDTDVLNDNTYYYYITADNGIESNRSEVDAGTPIVNFGNFVEFGSGTDDVTISDSDELGFNNEYFTISFWLYVNTLPLPANEANLVVRYDNTSPTPVETYFLRVNGNGELEFGEGGFSASFSTASVISENQWYHIAVEYSPSFAGAVFGNSRIYVDGTEVLETGFMANPGASAGGITVLGGDRTVNGRFLNGIIDELSFWDTDLLASEIQDLECIQLRGDEANLVGLYHFNAVDGNLYDYSVNQNNASIAGGVEINNFRPVALQDALSMDEDDTFSIVDIQDNDNFNGASILETSLLSGYPLNGSVNLLNQDSIEYQPNSDFFGSDTIKYVINSFTNQKRSCADSLYDTASVIITIDAVNDAPVIVNDLNTEIDTLRLTLDEDLMDTIQVLSTDIENDDRLILSVNSQNSSSSFTLNSPNDSSFIYTPEPNFNESDTLEVIIEDDGSPNMTDTLTVIIGLTPVNDPPVIEDDAENPINTIAITATEDTEIQINIYSSDIDNDSRSILSVNSLNSSPSISINNPNDTSFLYLSELNFDQYDSLEVVIQDSGSPTLTDTAIFIIDLTSVNDKPEITDISGALSDTLSYSTNEDTALSISLYNSDVDGDEISISEVISFNTGATFELNTSNDTTFSYRPPVDFNGYDTLRVVVEDNGTPILTDTVYVIVSVDALNDAPVIVDSENNALDTLNLLIDEDTSLDISLFINDIDNDEPVITAISSYNTSSSTSISSPADTSFNYIPESNFFGFDTLLVVASDEGTPELFDSLIVILDISSINDQPEITDSSLNPVDTLNFSVDEDAGLEISLFHSDIDGDDVVVAKVESFNTASTFSLNSPNDSSFIYSPPLNFNGSDTLKVVIEDTGSPTLQDSIIVIVTVDPINDAPNFINDSGDPIDTLVVSATEDISLDINLRITDIDGDSPSLESITTEASLSSFDIISDSSFYYTPEDNYHGTDTLLVVAQDGTSSPLYDSLVVIMQIDPVNDNPEITNATGSSVDTLYYDVDEDEDLIIGVFHTDIENDNISISEVLSFNLSPSFTLNSPNDSSFIYSPELNYYGTDTLKVIIEDDGSPILPDSAILVITINQVNDPPIIINETGNSIDTLIVSAIEDALLDINLIATDIDGDTPFIESILTSELSSSIAILNNTSFSYMSESNYYGNDTLTVVFQDRISDPLYDSVVVILEISSVNDNPEFTDSSNTPTDSILLTINEDESVEIDLNYRDIDGDEIILTNVNSEISSSININYTDTTLLYTPPGNFFGVDILTVSINDNGTPVGSDSLIIEINILPINDPPIIVDIDSNPIDTIQYSIDEDQQITFTISTIDPENDQITISSVTSNFPGASIILSSSNNSEFQYTPEMNYFGMDHITAVVSDNGIPSLTDTVVITLDILEVNDAPVVTDSLGVPRDTLYFIADEDVLQIIEIAAIDIEEDNLLIDRIISPGNENITINDPSDNSFTYLSIQNFNGIEYFQVIISDDGIPSRSDSVIVVMDVLPINDAPLIVDSEGNSIDTIAVVTASRNLDVCINTFDVDGDQVNISELSELPNVSTNIIDANCFHIEVQEKLEEPEYIWLVTCDNGTPTLCDSVIVQVESAINEAPYFVDSDFQQVDTLIYSITDFEVLDICVNINDDGSLLSIEYKTTGQVSETFETSPGEFCFDFDPNQLDNVASPIQVVVCDDFWIPECDTLIVLFDYENQTIPQGISPNGDQIGDVWVIPGIEVFPRNKVTIYDRWGALVYEEFGYNNTDKIWQGQSNAGLTIGSNNLPDGTYYYMIDYGENEKPINGFVMIKR